ncbi:MAG: hypothetical protein K6A33_06210, partial [Clostridiales bacterium]|nr:hypothetical protein [Clostridiales bacterium]
NTPAPETAPETEEQLPAPEVKNMGGAVLTIMNMTPEAFNWADTRMFAEETNGEILNDALFSREQKVEELYGCSLEELKTQNNSGADMSKAVKAGDHVCDAAMVFDASVSGVLTQGVLLPWNELDLDLSNPWWDSAATEQYNFFGIQAAVSGAYSLYNYSTRHCYVFNSDLLESSAPGTDLYSEVREGRWTVDRMYELGALGVLDLNGDGEMKTADDQWGIVSSVTRHYSAMLAGAGVKYIGRDEEGNLLFAIPANEYAQNVISKLVQLNVGNDIYTSGTNDIGGGAESPVFYNGRAMFIAAYVGEAARMRDIEFNIGIVPPPKFTEDQDRYYSLVEGGAQCVLPKTLAGEAAAAASVLLDAFAYYSFVESVPAYIDVVLMTKVARNEDSSEMLEACFDSSFYDLGTGIWSADTKNQFTSSVFLPRNDTVASLCAKIQKTIGKQLERFTKSVMEMQG